MNDYVRWSWENKMNELMNSNITFCKTFFIFFPSFFLFTFHIDPTYSNLFSINKKNFFLTKWKKIIISLAIPLPHWMTPKNKIIACYPFTYTTKFYTGLVIKKFFFTFMLSVYKIYYSRKLKCFFRLISKKHFIFNV